MPDPVAEGAEASLESTLYIQDYRMYTQDDRIRLLA